MVSILLRTERLSLRLAGANTSLERLWTRGNRRVKISFPESGLTHFWPYAINRTTELSRFMATTILIAR